MTTTFPNILDNLTNPAGGDSQAAAPTHSQQHANANDAIEAIQAKLGTDFSADTSSIDYKVRNISTLSTFTQAGSGASIRTIAAKLSDQFAATDFATLASAVGQGYVLHKTTNIPAGIYNFTGAVSEAHITMDYGTIAAEPSTQPYRINLIGDGAGDTLVSHNQAGKYAIKFSGGTNYNSHSYDRITSLSFSGAAGTEYGIWLYNKAFTEVSDCGFFSLSTCITLESCLSSHFKNLTMRGGVTGIISKKGTGFSTGNANNFSGCKFALLTRLAYDQTEGACNVSFTNGCVVEYCGTQADATKGGMKLVLDSSFGDVGGSFRDMYFEGNAGGFDVSLSNAGSEYITVVFDSCNFNRVSSAAFVTNNVVATGKIRLRFVNCSFSHFGTYTPNAGRPYVNADANVIVTFENCKFRSATEQGNYRNTDDYPVLSGHVPTAGTGSTLPAGWTASKTGTGVYNVVHNLNITITDYAVQATSADSSATVCQRIAKSINSFDVVMTNVAGAATDAPFQFTFQKIPK